MFYDNVLSMQNYTQRISLPAGAELKTWLLNESVYCKLNCYFMMRLVLNGADGRNVKFWISLLADIKLCGPAVSLCLGSLQIKIKLRQKNRVLACEQVIRISRLFTGLRFKLFHPLK